MSDEPAAGKVAELFRQEIRFSKSGPQFHQRWKPLERL